MKFANKKMKFANKKILHKLISGNKFHMKKEKTKNICTT